MEHGCVFRQTRRLLAPVGCGNPAITRVRVPLSLAQRPLLGPDLFALDAKNL